MTKILISIDVVDVNTLYNVLTELKDKLNPDEICKNIPISIVGNTFEAFIETID